MKVFIITLVLIGCASSATIESKIETIKKDLKKFANSTRDTVVDELQAVIGPFYDDAKTMNSFYSKTQLGSSSKAFDAVVAYINEIRSNDKTFTAIMDDQLKEYPAKIDALFESAAATVAASACQSKVLSSLSKFSSALQARIKAAVRDVRKENEKRVKDYREMIMKHGFEEYEASVKFCTKPANVKNPMCTSLPSLAEHGPESAQMFRDTVERFNESYLSESAHEILNPDNVENDFDRALNVEC